MSKMSDIQKRVDEAMDSILGINPASADPFLHTRVMARIEGRQNNYWEKVGRVVSRPAFAFITVSMILMLNLFVAINETSATTAKAGFPEVATAEDLGTNSFYGIENVQP